MSISMKRNLAQLHQSDTNLVDNSVAKRRCPTISTKSVDYTNLHKKLTINVSSDDDSESSLDDEGGDVDSNISIKSRSIKALQRSLRFIAPIDSKLSKAVAQYSDNEEDYEITEESSTSISSRKHHDTYESTDKDKNNSHHFDSLKTRSQSTTDILSFNYSNNKGDHSNVENSLKNQTKIDNFITFNKLKQNSMSVPQSDFIARSRCFNYLVTAIDEAWARYCDSTSYDEDVAYELSEDNESSIQTANTPVSNTYTSDDDDGYKSEFSATTSVTEYDSDYHNKPSQTKVRSFGIMNTNINQVQHNRRVSEVPENLRLQELKDRFTKSKYFLEDLVDSDSYNDCIAFWNKWDLIKYSIVDFVEEDEDDDDVEKKIDELESGRFVGSLSSY
ncbi:hypothetical protein CANINC_002383 [Pichia inconspicua]|uniref:Uncharacterized protein n=1 Tax=Pichia inconspicua TaxID=52247 RepID=A0A4V4NFQ8_9ASCO|nr:hypothetical protein CANINC_002383 [[Candida] inconspicua]